MLQIHVGRCNIKPVRPDREAGRAGGTIMTYYVVDCGYGMYSNKAFSSASEAAEYCEIVKKSGELYVRPHVIMAEGPKTALKSNPGFIQKLSTHKVIRWLVETLIDSSNNDVVAQNWENAPNMNDQVLSREKLIEAIKKLTYSEKEEDCECYYIPTDIVRDNEENKYIAYGGWLCIYERNDSLSFNFLGGAYCGHDNRPLLVLPVAHYTILRDEEEQVSADITYPSDLFPYDILFSATHEFSRHGSVGIDPVTLELYGKADEIGQMILQIANRPEESHTDYGYTRYRFVVNGKYVWEQFHTPQEIKNLMCQVTIIGDLQKFSYIPCPEGYISYEHAPLKKFANALLETD
jgi:hypothetical protein